ncbi:uncharacterized protein LOC142865815 [Microcebus murinus]|uniref:uncharacterized protein LOC142865815 n=1 Tax=Microcebus murinus TaxID=30608 RepID=UPI003F6CA0B7
MAGITVLTPNSSKFPPAKEERQINANAWIQTIPLLFLIWPTLLLPLCHPMGTYLSGSGDLGVEVRRLEKPRHRKRVPGETVLGVAIGLRRGGPLTPDLTPVPGVSPRGWGVGERDVARKWGLEEEGKGQWRSRRCQSLPHNVPESFTYSRPRFPDQTCRSQPALPHLISPAGCSGRPAPRLKLPTRTQRGSDFKPPPPSPHWVTAMPRSQPAFARAATSFFEGGTSGLAEGWRGLKRSVFPSIMEGAYHPLRASTLIARGIWYSLLEEAGEACSPTVHSGCHIAFDHHISLGSSLLSVTVS